MKPAFDTIIAGAGLAGACAALHLSRTQRLLVVEADRPAAGASGAAAGLVNPLTGRRARAVWRIDAALDALHATLDQAGATALLRAGGVLRPAADAQQADRFQEVAAARPRHATWLPAGAVRARFPGVAAPEGALLVRQGGSIPVPRLVEALLAAAQRSGAEVRTGARVTGWSEDSGGAFVALERGERLRARRVVLALGYGYRRHAELAALNLHAVKGQTVRVRAPDGCVLPVALSGPGYVAPDGEALVVGSSYERGFADLEPSAAQSQAILAQAARMLPALADAAVLDAFAGVRVTVPGTRLPMLGPLPGRARVWLFTGLGSKGLLTAPLLARALPLFFEEPARIPAEVRVR